MYTLSTHSEVHTQIQNYTLSPYSYMSTGFTTPWLFLSSLLSCYWFFVIMTELQCFLVRLCQMALQATAGPPVDPTLIQQILQSGSSSGFPTTGAPSDRSSDQKLTSEGHVPLSDSQCQSVPTYHTLDKSNPQSPSHGISRSVSAEISLPESDISSENEERCVQSNPTQITIYDHESSPEWPNGDINYHINKSASDSNVESRSVGWAMLSTAIIERKIVLVTLILSRVLACISAPDAIMSSARAFLEIHQKEPILFLPKQFA